MIRNDYLIRQIELLGEFLRRIAGRTELGEELLAEGDLERASRDLVGLDWALLRSMPPEQLKSLFALGGSVDLAKMYAAAKLLECEGSLIMHRETNGLEAGQHLCTAAWLLADCYQASDDPQFQQSCRTDLDKIVSALAVYELPNFLKPRLLEYFESVGEYARVEDLLFEMADASPNDDLRHAGLAFYERLLALEDSKLATGNLPRSEVIASLDQWRARFPEV